MLLELKTLEDTNSPIRVGLVGAGAMGLGIAHQINITPGMQLVWVADQDAKVAEKASAIANHCLFGTDVAELFENQPIDVFVESTNSILSALEYCKLAITRGTHVVLMNAEVDLAFGPMLQKLAKQHNVIVTSDAGDQHGVLATMIEEIQLWGFEIVQAGNIKGFLNRYATAESLLHEAKIRNLNPIQCCAYTDGTKLNIEMSVLANAFGYLPTQTGMTGPRADNVDEALTLFDFSEYPPTGAIDYILGSEPDGGVYIIGKCDNAIQKPYLKYYKLIHIADTPYYLFYRPYHLCHLETPKAIYQAFQEKSAILQPWHGRLTEVYAYAKADFPAGTLIEEAIGSDIVYGMVEKVHAHSQKLPIAVLESETTKPKLKKAIQKDEPLSYEHIEWTDRTMLDLYLDPSNH